MELNSFPKGMKTDKIKIAGASGEAGPSLLASIDPFQEVARNEADKRLRLARLGRRPDGQIKEWGNHAHKGAPKRRYTGLLRTHYRIEVQQKRDRDRLEKGIKRVNLTGWGMDAGMYMTAESAQRAIKRLARWIVANQDKPSTACPRHIVKNAARAQGQFR